jgi:glycosyltransferase involved in cell wall biosynthesis
MTELAPARYIFTVFTATFNRAHTLDRVYTSLAQQTYRDFEWLVVDDGSTDNTSQLIEAWMTEASFPIRYFQQENMGKHIAFNRGVEYAEGELLLVLDSDDGCVPQALEQLKYHWDQIDDQKRAGFSAVTALCTDQDGNLVGDKFPQDVMDSDPLELRYRYKVRGEKWGFQRTDILRRYPFPEELRQTYVPEDIIWNKIARKYKTRFVNELLRIYWVEGASLVHHQDPGKNAVGGRLQHCDALNNDIKWFRFAPLRFALSALHYSRFSFHTDVSIHTQLNSLSNYVAKTLWLLMLPMGFIIYLKDKK